MRITVTVDLLSPGARDWLLKNLPREFMFPQDEPRVCVTFTGEEDVHIEVPIPEFILVLRQLQEHCRFLEAVLTPDALADYLP